MKYIALLLSLVLSPVVFAQSDVGTGTAPLYVVLASGWDLDGEAADADQVVTAANGVIVDAKTDYTITAQPDTCRLLDITIADTDMTAGTITVTGTDCLGYAQSCSWSAWTAGDDDGVKTLTCANGRGAYFATVTGVATGTMTGESDESFTLGYTTNSAEGWPMYGTKWQLANGIQGVNPFGFYDGLVPVSTSGYSTTISGANAFTDLLAGDLLYLKVGEQTYTRRIVTRTSASAVVVDSAINIATPITFSWKKFYFSTNPTDQLWLRYGNFERSTWIINIDANANTGGVTHSLKCYASDGFDSTMPVIVAGTANTATAAAATAYSHTVDAVQFGYCKLGFYFGTGDDADAAAENISARIVLNRN